MKMMNYLNWMTEKKNCLTMKMTNLSLIGYLSWNCLSWNCSYSSLNYYSMTDLMRKNWNWMMNWNSTTYY